MTNFSKLKAGAAPLALGIALVAAPAFAQDAPQAADTATTADAAPAAQIVVTGSRIVSPNVESTTPVTVVSAQEIKDTGTTRVEDLTNSLPQVFAGQGSNVSNGASGTATLDLRGLGSARTLVLVNGRRVVPGDPGSSAADINIIPGSMIKRIDVLTGGASSVYGADAVSGVVNFVMDTDFEGFRLDSQYSFYNHNNRVGTDVTNALDSRGFGYPSGNTADGGTVDVTASFGAGFDDGRGHITAYAGYRKVNAVTQSQRDYSACALGASSTAAVAAGGNPYSCGGSLTSPTGSFIVYSSFGDPTDLVGGGADGKSPDGIADSFTSTIYQVGTGRTLDNSFTRYNYAPLNYFQRPDERYTAGLFADYEISEALHPYMEFMFMDDRTVAQIAPSGDFGNTLSINCDNPLISAQEYSILCSNENLLVSSDPARAFDVVGNSPGETAYNFVDPTTGATYNKGFLQLLRRDVEGGPRQDDLEHTSYRGVLGMKGDLGTAWNYDVYYQYGRTITNQIYLNDFSVSRMTKALDIVTDPSTGQAVCRSALSGEDPNCVPWDIFAEGGVTQAAIDYLATPGFSRGINTEQVLSGYMSGNLGEYGLKSPWANDGLSIVVGGEYRKETLDFQSDLEFQTGDLAGQGAATLPVSGAFDVKEVFTELQVPLVQNSFIYSASITGGYRYSSYKVEGGGTFTSDTYKIEGEISPIRDIKFRAGYNRAVRAPTLQDLFSPNRVALDGATDPCAGTSEDPKGPLTAADTGCLAQGLSVGQTVTPNPANQYNGYVGGNANLSPEIADTWTIGTVLQPRFLPGFLASVDYFNIRIKDAIQGIGADTIVSLCTSTSDPFYCGLVHRDASGSLWRTSDGYVIDTNQNIGGASTKGIDFTAAYNRRIGNVGRLSVSFVGTYLIDLVTDDGVSTPYDCAGYFGAVCGTPKPEWRHQMRVGFDLPSGVGMSVRWRYFDPIHQDTSSSQTTLSGTTQPANLRIGAVSYFDLAFNARIGDHYKFRFGANNVFDKSPPITAGAACPAGSCNGNVWAQVYDSMGRYIYAGVTLDF